MALFIVLIRFIFAEVFDHCSNGWFAFCLSLSLTSLYSLLDMFSKCSLLICVSSSVNFSKLELTCFLLWVMLSALFLRSHLDTQDYLGRILCIILLCFVFRSIICFEFILRGIKSVFLSGHIFVPALSFVEKKKRKKFLL